MLSADHQTSVKYKSGVSWQLSISIWSSLPVADAGYLLVKSIQQFLSLLCCSDNEFILCKIVRVPQDIIDPCETIFCLGDVNSFTIGCQQVRSFVKVCSFAADQANNFWEGLLNNFSEIFHPRHEIQQLRHSKINEHLPLRSSNLRQNLVWTEMRHTSCPNDFDRPIRRKTGCHLFCDERYLRRQLVSSTQNATEKLVPFFIFRIATFTLEKGGTRTCQQKISATRGRPMEERTKNRHLSVCGRTWAAMFSKTSTPLCAWMQEPRVRKHYHMLRLNNCFSNRESTTYRASMSL